MNEKYKLPDTVLEIEKRRDELEEKINAYNELLLSEQPTNMTDEEVQEMFDEYQYLVEIIGQKVIEDEPSEPTFFDKVAFWIYIYGFISILISLWFILEYIGQNIFVKIYQNNIDYFEALEVGQHKLIISLVFCIYPVILVIVSAILNLIFARKKENRIVFTIFEIIQFLTLVIGVICVIVSTFKSIGI